jgi:hypothetical protein
MNRSVDRWCGTLLSGTAVCFSHVAPFILSDIALTERKLEEEV